MQNSQQTKPPFSVQVESIGYLLTGLFAISIALKVQESNGTTSFQIDNLITLVLGAILITTSFVYLFSIFTSLSQLASRFYNRLVQLNIFPFLRNRETKRGQYLEHIKRGIGFSIFAFTYLQVFIGLIQSFIVPFPTIIKNIYILYIILLPISTVYAFIKSSSLAQLLYVTALLTGFALYVLFIQDFTNTIFTFFNINVSSGHIGLSFVLLLILIVICCAIKKFIKREKPRNDISTNHPLA